MKNKKMDKKLIGRIVFFIVIIGIGSYVIRGSWGEIWQQLKVTPYNVILGIILLGFVYYLFEAAAITFLMKKTGEKFTYIKGLGTVLYMGFFRVVTFGSGTAAGGMYYAKQKGIPLSKSLGVFTISYLFQRIVVVCYFVIAYFLNFSDLRKMFFPYEKQMLSGIFVALLIAMVLLLFCISKKLHQLIFFILDKFVRAEKTKKKVAEIEIKAEILRVSSVEILKDGKVWLILFILNIGKLTAFYLIPCVIFGCSTIQELSIVVGITSIMYALAGVVPVPGGVGAIEFLFTLFFTPLVGSIKAVSAAITFRIATYFLPALWGSFVFWGIKTKKLKEDILLK